MDGCFPTALGRQLASVSVCYASRNCRHYGKFWRYRLFRRNDCVTITILTTIKRRRRIIDHHHHHHGFDVGSGIIISLTSIFFQDLNHRILSAASQTFLSDGHCDVWSNILATSRLVIVTPPLNGETSCLVTISAGLFRPAKVGASCYWRDALS